MPEHIRSLQGKDQSKRLVVILEQASLELAKVGKAKEEELLQSDKHWAYMKKYKKNEENAGRPDITHQCLMMLLDHPLNRADMLQVFIHTNKNVFIQVDPSCRIPRTYDRFCGLMKQLLKTLSISADGGNKKLLKVIDHPIEKHLPTGCLKICMSFTSEGEPERPRDLIPKDGTPLVVVIGAQAKGRVNPDYTSRDVKISNYPLSAALCCSQIADGAAAEWGIH